MKTKKRIAYEALWYEGDIIKTKAYLTKKSVMKFYEKHKDDVDKKDWWVTKRDEEWHVLEDIIL